MTFWMGEGWDSFVFRRITGFPIIWSLSFFLNLSVYSWAPSAELKDCGFPFCCKWSCFFESPLPSHGISGNQVCKHTNLPCCMETKKPQLNSFCFIFKKHEFFSFIAECFKMLSEDGSKLQCNQRCAGSWVTFRKTVHILGLGVL